MILDTLSSIDKYFDLCSGIEEGLKFLVKAKNTQLGDGRHEIKGGEVYASISNEAGKGVDDAQLETHQKYIDIHFCLKGIDCIGWSPTAEVTESLGEYSYEKDVSFFLDKPSKYINISDSIFCILFPDDAHAPLSGTGAIRKIVIKIKVLH